MNVKARAGVIGIIAALCALVIVLGLRGGSSTQLTATTTTTTTSTHTGRSAPTIPPPTSTTEASPAVPATTTTAADETTGTVATVPETPTTVPAVSVPTSETSVPTTATSAAPSPIDWRSIVPAPPNGGKGTLDSQTGDEYRAHFTWSSRNHEDLVEPIAASFESKGWASITSGTTIVVTRPGVSGTVTARAGDGGAGTATVVYDLRRS